MLSGHYQALGRFIYAENLKEQLRIQKHFNFAHKRKTMGIVNQLDVLADTLYIEVNYSSTLLDQRLNKYVLNQWIALLVRSDWPLRLQIASAIHLQAAR